MGSLFPKRTPFIARLSTEHVEGIVNKALQDRDTVAERLIFGRKPCRRDPIWHLRSPTGELLYLKNVGVR